MVGTIAMDVLLYARYRRGGGEDPFWSWESAAGVVDWETASAPGQLGQKATRLVTRRQPSDDLARPMTNAVHWATGAAWAAQYAVLASRPTKHPLIRGLALGPAVWLAGYAVLPLAGVYQAIWTYDARTLADDLSAHVLYGVATSATVAALNRP
ncbi:MAG TPA: hypothetical protein VHK88_07350 [Aquihabitans sp.]|nr:hypothetical protein [Aquihabitans sp.]